MRDQPVGKLWGRYFLDAEIRNSTRTRWNDAICRWGEASLLRPIRLFFDEFLCLFDDMGYADAELLQGDLSGG